MFMPRRLRFLGAWLTILMQLVIIATSNHNYANFLVLALCLFLFDDRAVARVVPGAVARWLQADAPPSPAGLLSAPAGPHASLPGRCLGCAPREGRKGPEVFAFPPLPGLGTLLGAGKSVTVGAYPQVGNGVAGEGVVLEQRNNRRRAFGEALQKLLEPARKDRVFRHEPDQPVHARMVRHNDFRPTLHVARFDDRDLTHGIAMLQSAIDDIRDDLQVAVRVGVETAARVKVLSVTEPPKREAGVIVETVEELVEKLKNEAKVI